MRTFIAFLFPLLSLHAIGFDKAAEEIVQAGVFLNNLRLCPATSGNFSRRIDGDLVAITASGKHKGELTTEDVLIVNMSGKVQGSAKKSSAETLLHTMLYNLCDKIGAVLHTHSTYGVMLSRLLATDSALVTDGYEIHKVFGIPTHESRLEIPIFDNSQDMVAFSAEVNAYLQEHPDTYGFLIRGHGLYTWGRDMNEARYRIEAFEHLFECELKLRTIRGQ